MSPANLKHMTLNEVEEKDAFPEKFQQKEKKTSSKQSSQLSVQLSSSPISGHANYSNILGHVCDINISHVRDFRQQSELDINKT